MLLLLRFGFSISFCFVLFAASCKSDCHPHFHRVSHGTSAGVPPSHPSHPPVLFVRHDGCKSIKQALYVRLCARFTAKEGGRCLCCPLGAKQIGSGSGSWVFCQQAIRSAKKNEGKKEDIRGIGGIGGIEGNGQHAPKKARARPLAYFGFRTFLFQRAHARATPFPPSSPCLAGGWSPLPSFLPLAFLLPSTCF